MTHLLDVAVIGAGPAGLSTAMYLCQRDPVWRDRLLVLEKARFPREKLCGGGLTRLVDLALEPLGLDLEELPHQRVDEARFRFPHRTFTVASRPAFRVVQRLEFDQWMYTCARQRGIRIEEGVQVRNVVRKRDHFRIHTSRGDFSARVVVGADGVNSIVRRRLGYPPGRKGRLLEVQTPEPATSREHLENAACFDFSYLGDGLQGYAWNFPCWQRREPHMNRGVVDMRISRARKRASLLEVFAVFLNRHDRPEAIDCLEGSGIRWFQPFARIGGSGHLLVGDAAGIDPFAGEGIPFALGYGELASAAIVQAFATDRLDFRGFNRKVLRSRWGKHLLQRRIVAELAYRLPVAAVFGLAGLLTHLTAGRVEVPPHRSTA